MRLYYSPLPAGLTLAGVCLFLHASACAPRGTAAAGTAPGPSTAVTTAAGADSPAAAPPRTIFHRGHKLYLNGFNIAWFQFANDIGNGVDETQLRQALHDLSTSGGNTLRWWIHTDGAYTPQWGPVDGATRVIGPGPRFIEDLQRALDIAAEYDALIVPSLWSFDMLRDNASRTPPNEANYQLLTEDSALQAYIDNALIPIVQAVNAHPALLGWELFNEPENVTEPWFVQDKAFYGGPVPSLEQLQRTQARMAAAIHRAAMENGQVALVTTGSKSMGKYNSDVAGGFNWYRDDRLVAAADGDPLAVFDFYEPHYYNNEGKKGLWSPFHHDASHWGVDKPIVIGEFYSTKALEVLGETLPGSAMCQRLVDRGYAGGWAWQWNEYPEAIAQCMGGMSHASP